MHGPMKRHEIQVLSKAGHTDQQVADITGVPTRSVRRIKAEPPVAGLDAAERTKERRVGRPPKVEAYRPFVTKLLADEPDLLTLEVLRRARLDGYNGGKSQFYTMVAQLRPKEVRPLVRFEGLPGEFSQHDFGQVDVRYTDGSVERIHFFASRLKWSRHAEVSIVPNQQVEPLVRSIVEHFDRIGGVPLLAVFDRPKTVALKWKKDGTVTEWNPVFSQAMAELSVAAEVCWPYRGQEKGSVENLVGWVKGSFFKQRRFIDRDDLEQQLAEWLYVVNNETPSRATGVAPAIRMKDEQHRLRSLKVKPDQLYLRIPIHVGPTGHVVHNTHVYSMPPASIGIAGTLFLGKDSVRIVAGRWSAEHERLVERNARSEHPEHRAQALAAVSGKRARRYLKREQLLQLGGAMHDYLTEIVHRRPRTWAGDVDRLHELLGVYGDHAVVIAVEHALDAQAYGAEYVDHLLQQVVETMAVSQEVCA